MIEELLEEAMKLSQNLLGADTQENREKYVASIQGLTERIKAADEPEIEAVKDVWLRNQLQTEQKLLIGLKGNCGHQWAAISIFTTYCLGRKKNYPRHSKQYMMEADHLKNILQEYTETDASSLWA